MRREKVKVTTNLPRYFTEKYLRPKYSLPSASYTCPMGLHHSTDCIRCVSLVQAAKSSHRRLAIRLLFRPIPRHFSRWGAKRDAAILRLQLGQTHSLLFHWLKTCPKMSNPGWSTISGGRRGVAIRAGRVPSSCSRQGPMSSLNSSLPKLTGAPGSASRAVSRKPSESHPSYPHLPTLGRTRPLSFHPEAHQNPSCYQDLYHPGRSSRT